MTYSENLRSISIMKVTIIYRSTYKTLDHASNYHGVQSPAPVTELGLQNLR